MGRTLHVAYRIRSPITLDVSLTVKGFTVLLGGSGPGKTTLLMALAGLVPAHGSSYARLPPERRPVGYMPQRNALFPHLTVRDNVAFPLLHLPSADRLGRATRLLEGMELAHKAQALPHELSQGQAQRVALARALARAPELVLLDEPTSALDAVTRNAVMTEVIGKLRAAGVPTLAVSHDPAVARMGDRVAVLAEGRILQQGSPEEVFNRPENRAVAELVEFGGLHPGVLVSTGSPWMRIRTSLGVLRAAHRRGLQPGQRILWCTRPEDVPGLELTGEAGQVKPANVVDALVGSAEVRIGSGTVALANPPGFVVAVPRNMRDRMNLSEGSRIRLLLEPAYIHVMAAGA